MSELALQQINAKCDTMIALLQNETHKRRAMETENRQLRLIIYRNHEFMRNTDHKVLNEIIAEFEPNYPDGG